MRAASPVRSQPSLSIARTCGVGAVPVARHDVRSLDEELAGLVGRALGAVRPCRAHVDKQQWPPCGTGLARRARGVEHRDDGRRLGETVTLQERHARGGRTFG